MNTRTKRLAILLGIAVLGLVTFILLYLNRGAPAADIAAYTSVSAIEQGEAFARIEGETDPPAGMQLAAENEALALYIDPESTEIAVRHRVSGKLWYSNPPDRDADPVAVPYEKERMSSPIIVSYRDSMGTLRTFTSYGQSVSFGQFTLESLSEGVRVTYTLEEASVGIDALPKLISRERLEEKVLSKLDENLARYVGNRYLPSGDNEQILERLDEELEGREVVLQRVVGAFEEAGYTEEDLAYDNAENGIAGAGDTGAKFVVPVEYRLDGESLVVTVPTDRMTESEGFAIRTLELLRHFGAAGTVEDGYMLIPDGTGALINLNNGKIRDEMYAQRIYGEDLNTSARQMGQIAEAARMPVFGLKTGDEAWLAVIEQADAIASVAADVSGKQHSYNHVFSSFALRGEDEYVLYKGNNIEIIPRLAEDRYKGDIQVRYSFLSGEEADYSGMARLYRSMLVEQGALKPLNATSSEPVTQSGTDQETDQETDSIPFFLDILGAVDKRQTFLGIPYHAPVALTTYDQAARIVDELEAGGVANIHMRLQGWFNNGFHHGLPATIKMVGGLGNREGFGQLSERLEALGGRLYPDVAFQHVYRDDRSFTPSSDAARFITREAAERAIYDLAYNRMRDSLGTYYLLSPAKLPYYVDRFIKEYAGYGLDAVSLRDLGDMLHADYRVDRLIPREGAKRIAIEQIAKIAEQYPYTMVEGGNVYAVPYTNKLVNVPYASSGYNIADAEVPFYQMVLHGYVDYAGPAVNLADDQDARYHMLRNIELGAAPHFLWTYEPTSMLKYTRFDYMYATQYTDWLSEALAMYGEINAALAPVRTAAMEEHIQHAEGVVEVVYDNGMSIVVNYTEHPVVVNGLQVDAIDYAIGGDRS